MKRLSVLYALLAAQLIVIAILWSFSFQLHGESAEPFLSFTPTDVAKVEIRDEENEVRLIKQDLGWQLESGLPADTSRVENLLEKLGRASGGWPVATSSSTAERFEVTRDKFQRHVVLHDGEAMLAEIYLGTSPGYRMTHARHVNGGPVYSIELSNYEASAEPSYWLDKNLLGPSGEIESVEQEAGFSLSAGEDGWSGSPETELDQAKVETLVSRIKNLSVMEVYEDPLPEAPLNRFVIGDGKGSYVLTLYSVGEGESEENVVTSSRVEDAAFGISSYIAEQMNKSLQDLAYKPIKLEPDAALGTDLPELKEETVDGEVAEAPPEEDGDSSSSESILASPAGRVAEDLIEEDLPLEQSDEDASSDGG